MSEKVDVTAEEEVFSSKQRLFMKYLTLTLVDLTVLNLFAEYWDKVILTSFGVSLFIAFTLQVLLKLTLVLEDKISFYIKSNESLNKKASRIFVIWLILFISKLVILGILELFFSDSLIFEGIYHGVITFIIVVAAILAAEYILSRIFHALK
jgi:hypothetical protein